MGPNTLFLIIQSPILDLWIGLHVRAQGFGVEETGQVDSEWSLLKSRVSPARVFRVSVFGLRVS